MNEPENWNDIDQSIRMIKSRLEEQEKAKNQAYWERNCLVVALSKQFPSHLAVDENAEQGWQTVVFVHLPTGQVSWHISDHDIELFRHLTIGPNNWDGHTTAEKYARIAAL